MSSGRTSPKANSTEKSSGKSVDSKLSLGLESERQGFPVINGIQKNLVMEHIVKEASLNLRKQSEEKLSESRMDAGEPHGSDFSLFSADLSEYKKACRHLKEIKMLDASPNEELNINLSEKKSVLSLVSIPLKAYDVKLEDPQIEESHALKRWEYWLKDKKRMQNRLSQRLGRPTSELLIQESDKYREVMEKKLMLWYSRIPEPDKWRGSPARWKPQLRIRNKKTHAQYCLIKSKIEKGERPELEFIGIPDAIKKEKGLLPDFDERDERIDYKPETQRKVHCKEESCDSHEIKMEELAVVGIKILVDGSQTQNLYKPKVVPSIIEPGFENEERPSCTDRISVFSLVIDKERIKYEIGRKNRQDPDRAFTWNIDFGVNIVKSTSEKILRIENQGTIAVKYDWLPSEKKEKENSFNALQPKRYEPWFFFNKNSGFFLPGQIYHLKFYFHPTTSGIRKEKWNLRTDPPLWQNAEFATIVLSGVATEECSTEMRELDFYLRKRVLDSNITSFVDFILYKVCDPTEELLGIEYRSIFSDKQLFEHQNPKHFYHSSIVKELKRVFEEIPDKTQTQWDLSLNSLWYFIKTYKTGKEQSDTLRKVAEMSKALFRPNYLRVRYTAEYRMTYEILCRMANFIEGDYNYLRNSVSEKIEEHANMGEIVEAREFTSSTSEASEEMGETDRAAMLHIKPINYVFFRAFLYLKVYCRVCEAAEQIAGIFETRKNFKAWKTVNYKPPKPPRIAKIPNVRVNYKYCPPNRRKAQVKILSSKD